MTNQEFEKALFYCANPKNVNNKTNKFCINKARIKLCMAKECVVKMRGENAPDDPIRNYFGSKYIKFDIYFIKGSFFALRSGCYFVKNSPKCDDSNFKSLEWEIDKQLNSLSFMKINNKEAIEWKKDIKEIYDKEFKNKKKFLEKYLNLYITQLNNNYYNLCSTN